MTPNHDDSALLPTGLPSLDGHIEGQGIRPRSILAVDAPPRSVGRRFVFNLCADRPVHYVAVGHDPAQYVEHVRTVTGLGQGDITTESLPPEGSGDALLDHLDSLGEQLQTRTTVLVDPLEVEGPATTRRVLEALRSVLAETDGLAVVLSFDADWPVLSAADAVFSIHHETTEDGVSHHVTVDRLPMGQRFREDDTARAFEVPPHLEMTLDTSKTLSP
jgi:hypothetical protein